MKEVLAFTFDPKILGRYLAKIKDGGPDECWEWLGSTGGSGYGEMRVNPGHLLIGAHRFAYALHYGEDPGDMLVCHRCDNRRCCNPKHLFLGTVSDNSQDMVEKGRDRRGPVIGSQNGNAKLSEADIHAIRAQIARGKNNCQIAKGYGVTHQMISKIRLGHYWKHVDGRHEDGTENENGARQKDLPPSEAFEIPQKEIGNESQSGGI